MGESPEKEQLAAPARNGIRFRSLGRVFLEVSALSLLAVLAVSQGREALSAWNGPGGSVTTELYLPAVSMAAGKGFTNLVPDSVPELRRFLDFQDFSFDAARLGASCQEQPLHSYQEYHRYLVQTVGWIWSHFGVTWGAVKLLLLAMFAVCLWEVYGISRLAMGPVAAFLVAMAFSWCPPLLMALGNLRDFSKAPFILGAILVLGLIIRRPRKAGALLALAAVAGVVLGVGLGFRRDAMVVVPFSVLVLAFAPVAVARRRRRMLARAAAVAVMTGVFCGCAWPILKAFHEHGTLAAHDTIMGFSTNADRELSLELASYEKLYVLNDLYCSVAAYDAGRRGVTGDPDEYRRRHTEYEFDDTLKTRYVLAMAARFPADMLTRAYGACLRILGGIWGPSDARLAALLPHGARYALIALFCVSMVNWRLATAMLAFVLFFAGYTSGQFSSRHAFHLEFAPLFFAGFLADRGVRMAVECLRRRPAGVAVGTAGSGLLRGLLQGVLWLVCVSAVLWGGLAVAGMWQGRQVERLVKGVMQAEKEPVPCRTGQWDDRVLFSPVSPDGCAKCQNAGFLVDFRTTVYVVHLKGGLDEPDLCLCYDIGDSFRDFSKAVRIELAPGAPCDLWYCFPVFEPTLCSEWSRFAGVSLPEAQAGRFKGFYRIEHPEQLDLLVNLVIPEASERFLDRQRLVVPWNGSLSPTYFGEVASSDVFDGIHRARQAAASGAWQAALTHWNGVAACRPRSLCAALGRVEALDRLGRSEEAMDVLEELLASLPEEGGACAVVDKYLMDNRGVAGRLAAWVELAGRLPQDGCVSRFLDDVLSSSSTPAG